MSTDGNTRIYEDEYESVLDECPEYSDPDSIHYDPEHCKDLAKIRADRRINS